LRSLSDIVDRLTPQGGGRRAARSSGLPMDEPRVAARGTSAFMRKHARALVRLADTMPRLRHGSGHALALGFVTLGWFYGAVVGGSAPAFVSGTAATFGLKATDIVITGQVETSEQDVFSALGVSGSIVGFSADDARERLLALPWVKNVAIRKIYPGKLTVALAEKRAMAVWQHKDRLTVVEKTGKPIAKFGISDLLNNRFSHLPHLVGDGAAERASEILPLASRYPAIAGRVKSYVHIAGRRWDLQLANGVRIKLPETKVDDALAHVAELENEDRLLEREVTVVDMRLPDRITLRLEEAAAKTRSELVSARLKAMKKADRKL